MGQHLGRFPGRQFVATRPQGLLVALASIALAVLLAAPAGAQEAYPPPEDDEVLDVVEEAEEQEPAAEVDPDEAVGADGAAEGDDADVEGVAVEADRDGLPVTGATLAVLLVTGLVAMAVGGAALVASRRRAPVA